MQEDGYIDLQLLESQEVPEDVCEVQSSKPCLSYSTGRFRNGAIGLCNIGPTSCLNPLLQTFYMNRDFTDLLLRIGELDDTVPVDRRFCYELLALFHDMQKSKDDAVAPYRFLRCLQSLRVSVYVQNDVADVFSTLLSLILQTIPDPYLTEKVRTLYTISLREQITCQRCSQQRTAHSDLLNIPLRVSHSKFHRKVTLERMFWRYFRSQEIHGDKTGCPKCEANRGVKVTQLRSLPRTLSIHLKRLSQKSMDKVNRTVSFPLVLDLLEVLDPEQLPSEECKTPSYSYHLFAVVAHTGTAASGHFCAYINSHKDRQWYFFNDSSICKVSWDDVKCTFGNSSLHWGVTACLLVYVQCEAE
ncbi:ubl carboxyl-terminal hydrolase 18 [Hyperolius riggenbachi]|uniref:ubl carboxyl-terminal hydrolase 18 n=1 Tax=Hyperolius riggenbachi TaxID=752182 RepID=UPI0035A3A735